MCENHNGVMRKNIHDRINLLKTLPEGELERQSQEAYAVLLDILKQTTEFMHDETITSIYDEHGNIAKPKELYIYINRNHPEGKPFFYIGYLLGMANHPDDTPMVERNLLFKNILGTIWYKLDYTQTNLDATKTLVLKNEEVIHRVSIGLSHICLARTYITHLLQTGKIDLIALIALYNNHPKLVLLHTFLQYHLCSEFGIYLGDETTREIVQPLPLIFSSNEMDEVGKGGTRSKPRYKKNRTKKNRKKRNRTKKNRTKKNRKNRNKIKSK